LISCRQRRRHVAARHAAAASAYAMLLLIGVVVAIRHGDIYAMPMIAPPMLPML